MTKVSYSILWIEAFQYKCVFLKGLLYYEPLKQHVVTTGLEQLFSNSAFYEHSLWKTLINYTNLITNVKIDRSIKILLNHPWSPHLRYSLKTSQSHLAHICLEKSKFKKISISISQSFGCKTENWCLQVRCW